MSKSTMSDVGHCFSFPYKKHSKAQACDTLVLFYIGLMLNIFFKKGRRAVKAGHYTSCQEAKEEIKVTSSNIFLT